jgi:hypothetical protein
MVRGVRVKTAISLVLRVITVGAVAAMEFRGRFLPYIFCHNRISGDVLRPVIDILRGVQFLMNINLMV